MVTPINLDSLNRISDLRKIWPHEAKDFTKWLSENLSFLGEAIGIELELVETESSVGSFSADIVAIDAGSNRKVIIENQLEPSNHTHLGQIITYASGKEASVVVWIVSRARDEHAQAVDWLNAHTDKDIGFFLLEIELWQIGNSQPAPRLNIVERPNEWGKSIKQAEGLTDAKKTQLAYWQEYNELARQTSEFMKEFSPQKAAPQHWTNLAVGSSAYHFNLAVDTQKKRIFVEFNVSDDKELFNKVKQSLVRFAHENDFSHSLWGEKTKSSGIRLYRDKCDVKGVPDKWNEFIAWQLETAIKLKRRIRELGL